MALGVAVGCRLARPAPAVRHSLWLIVLLRLLMPPGLHWPWAIPLQSPLERTPEPVVQTPGEPLTASLVAEEFIAMESAAPVPVDTVAVSSAPTPPDWAALSQWTALAIWGVGALLIATREGRRLVALKRRMADAIIAPESLTCRITEIAAKLGIAVPPVRVVNGLASPMVVGFLKPVLWWPAGLELRLPRDGMRAVLIHELAHLRRRDHWVRWLELAAACLCWWNPVFAIIRRQLRRYAELACDAWVLTLLPQARRAYAEALIQVCEQVSNPAPVVAMGIGGEGRREFQRRLTMIMRDKVSCSAPRRALLAVTLLGLLAIPGFTLGREQPVAAVLQPDEMAVDVRLNLNTATDPDSDVAKIVFFLNGRLEEAGSAAEVDREKKLQELEARIKALLTEIAAIKNHVGSGKPADSTTPSRRLFESRVISPASGYHNDPMARRSHHEIMLSRATYQVPHAKAESLARFLRTHLTASVVDVKIDGDKLTVTTTPEAQQTIKQLIALVQAQPLGSLFLAPVLQGKSFDLNWSYDSLTRTEKETDFARGRLDALKRYANPPEKPN
jgi:beta-lactamase regulating signal transducer with metallopeptidase domain